MDGAWVEYDLGPTTIGVGCHPAWKPSRDGTTIAFEVEDMDAAIESGLRRTSAISERRPFGERIERPRIYADPLPGTHGAREVTTARAVISTARGP